MDPILEKVLGWVNALLGTDFKIDGDVNLTKEQKQSLDQAAKKEGFADAFLQELESSNENTAANQFITEFMQNQAEDESDESDSNGENENVIASEASQSADTTVNANLTENVRALAQRVVNAEGENKKLQQQVAKLAASPEDDVPVAVITQSPTSDKMNIAKHTKTHVFGVAESYNKITADRPWNKVISEIRSKADVLNYKGTNWNTVNIEKINEDFGAYARKNLDKIIPLLRDGFSIPSNWKVIIKISDEMTWMNLLSGQITQAKKKAWLPKNKNKFIPQKAKIYDKQIDATWTGWELKSIEKTYLNSFFNNVGSDPYKIPFVEYLFQELLKQARKEDKITIFKGVHFPGDDMQIAGDFMNAMSGLYKLIRGKAEAGEYNPFNLPALNANNTYNTINAAVQMLPHWFRILPNVVVYLSPTDLKNYHDNRELAKGTNTDYAGKEPHVEGYANIKFITTPQAEGTGFFYITTDNNIDLMVDEPGEESMIHLSKDGKRNINAHADYKLGVFVYLFGAQMNDGKLVGYENQLFFSNKVELLEDVFVPVTSNNATPDLQYHHSLIIGEHNTAATDITDFINETPGKKVFLRGNNDVNPSTVKTGANIDIPADVELTSTTELVLVAGSDGVFRLYEQIDLAAASDAVELADGATTADAALGTEFITQSNGGATAIVNITNAVKDEEYAIRGGSDNNATTIADAGNFNLTAAMTLNDGTYIKVLYNGTQFIETERG